MARREDCERVVKEAIDGLNGLDIVVSNAVSLACIENFMAHRPSLLSIMLLLIHCRGLQSFRNWGRKERNLAILIS